MPASRDNHGRLDLAAEDIGVEAVDRQYLRLRFDRPDAAGADVSLTREQALELFRACRPYLREFAPELEPVDGEVVAACRRKAAHMAGLTDRQWEHLLRELPAETLKAFLWFMQDTGLLERVLGNMSRVAAEMLAADIDTEWGDREPDEVPEVVARVGQQAVEDVIRTWNELHAAGQV